MLPLQKTDKGLVLGSAAFFDYLDVIAPSVSQAVLLLLDVLKYCEQRGFTLTLERVSHRSMLYEALQSPVVRAAAELLVHRVVSSRIGCFHQDENALPAVSEFRIDHRSGRQITEDLIHECGELQKSRFRRSLFRRENFKHYLSLLARNTEQLILTTMRTRDDGELSGFVMGYFANGRFHYLAPDGEYSHPPPAALGLSLIRFTLDHLCRTQDFQSIEYDLLRGSRTKGKPGLKGAANSYLISKIVLFPGDGHNQAAIKGARFLYKAKDLKEHFCHRFAAI